MQPVQMYPAKTIILESGSDTNLLIKENKLFFSEAALWAAFFISQCV
jgi:hypothetical protein